MPSISTSLALVLPFLAPLVSAHGHVSGIVADGKWYTGWNAAYRYQNPIPKTAGWQADNLDNGFVSPSDFASNNIICHKSGKSNGVHIPVKAGSKVTFQWDAWPESHKGPVIDYIASCNGDCDTVTPSSLLWTKFAEGAWKSGNNPGLWVTDDLIKSNLSWTTTVPANLAPGNYVIRHEIIALHAGGQSNGAQSYPQCVNFKIEGSGTVKLTGGVKATTFYKASDAGILFNLFTKFTGYTIPGPSVKKEFKREVREHSREWSS